MPGFVIHALQVSDGILALAPVPGGGGRYDQDLAHIRDWKPALVLSMATPDEMDATGAGNLGQDLRDSGTRWVPFPVADFDVPGPGMDEDWKMFSRSALASLRGGGRVLIHCKGGCGRSGMAALRLMVAAGEAPDKALKRLRALRPCAVETKAQLAWATAG